jgi:hypothetical protein
MIHLINFFSFFTSLCISLCLGWIQHDAINLMDLVKLAPEVRTTGTRLQKKNLCLKSLRSCIGAMNRNEVIANYKL